MSAAKKDRTTAPRIGSRPSKAKQTDDRNVRPPAGYKATGKPKPGERAMEAQLAAGAGERAEVSYDAIEGGQAAPSAPATPPTPEDVAGALVVSDPDDQPPPKDPWWTDEREKVFAWVLQGVPQHQVAAELDRDRHTIARWVDDERFAQRLYDENVSRFKSSRQRRSIQTVRLTDKAEHLAGKMLDKAITLAENGEDQLGVRLAARDWLQEFRENSRREDEIFGLSQQRVDVNVHGQVQHQHKGKVNVTFKAFLSTSLQGIGVDLENEEIDASRADDALAAITERALMEGSFLDDLVEQEKANPLAPALSSGERGAR